MIQEEGSSPTSFIASNLKEIQESFALKFNEKVQSLIKDGKEIYHFGFGESRFPVHEKIASEFCSNVNQISYEPIGGIDVLKHAASHYWNSKYDTYYTAETTHIGTGSKILFHDVLQVLDGDLILPRPTWVAYEPQAKMFNKKILWIDTKPSNNYCVTARDLEDAIRQSSTNNPRILFITQPGNPTGTVYTQAQIQELAVICRKYDLTVISDEIYAPINHGIVPHTSFGKIYPEKTIVTSGLSKAFSLGGWRLGFAFLPDNDFGRTVGQYLHRVAGSSWSVAASPVQFAAVTALNLDEDVEIYIDLCTGLHSLATQFMYDWLRNNHIKVVQPHGGFYVYADFSEHREFLKKHDINNGVELSEYLLNLYGIAALAGENFSDLPSSYRLRFATSYVYTPTYEKATVALQKYSKYVEKGTEKELSIEIAEDIFPELVEGCRKISQFVSAIHE